MSKVVGDIAVQVGADVTAFERGMDRAKRSTKDFDKQFALTSRNIKRAGAAMGVAAVAAAAGFAKVAASALEAAENIADIANKSGASIRGLQRLRFAADQNGSSARDMDDALTRLTRRMSLFATDGGGPAAKAIEQLGLNIRNADGSLRASDEVFAEIAQRFETLEDSAQKAALASQLFGEDAGPRLVPLLSQGADGVRAFGDEAERLGIVLDDVAVSKAGAANAQLRALGMSVKGQLTGAILDNVEAIEALAAGLGAIIGVVGSAVESVSNLVREMVDLYDATRSVLGLAQRGAPGMTGGSRNAIEAEYFGSLPPGAMLQGAGPMPAEFLLPPQLPRIAPTAGSSGLAPTAGSSGAVIGSNSSVFGPGTSGTITGTDLTDTPEGQAILAGMNIGSTMAGGDGGGTGVPAIDELPSRYQDIVDQIEQIRSDHVDEQLAGWGSFFGDLGNLMGSEGEKMLKIAKAFNAGQALANAWLAYTDVLANHPGDLFMKMAAGAKVLAAGIGAVNAIKSVGKGGTGGAASGGASAGSTAAAAAPAPLEVRLSGISADTIISGADLGGLLDRLNEEAGDRGTRLTIAT